MQSHELAVIQAWDATIDESTYYEILGILEIADDEAIKNAYREFARAFHPDVHPDASAEVARTLRRIFQRGVEAYRTLCDPKLRAAYDMALARGAIRMKDSQLPPQILGGAKSLEDLCTTMSAKLAARKADELITNGDLRGAKRELMMAIVHEGGGNTELAERLDALDLAMFAKGQ
ncbi:MAG TPA: DnaJ domain-containing protein [Polyangiaceae bacterium]|nr:DnaJ domain-containing protein [Polyangiaceae bacterium]